VDYIEAMAFIKECDKYGSKLGLERITALLKLLDEPDKKIKVIHVAGTNGKGSTSVMIATALSACGYNIGMFTSPYLETFEDCMKINGKNISKKALSKVITEVYEAIPQLLSLGFEHPTSFEIQCSAMFLYFYKSKVDYAVVEVGLGGRGDATNVVSPVLTVITSISMDHMTILGDTLEKIAFQKAGIIKEGVPVVCYPQQEKAMGVLIRTATEKHSQVITVPEDSAAFIKSSVDEKSKKIFQRILVKTSGYNYNIKLSLLGTYQLLNCATAIFALEALKLDLDKDKIIDSLSKITWPGRLEILKFGTKVVIDGAHNIDAMIRLNESIEKYFTYKNIILILGILKDKEMEKMIKIIAPMASRIICVTPHNARAQKAKDLLKLVSWYNENSIEIEDYKTAYQKALAYSDKKDLILITGSLYMVGDMRKVIRQVKE
jgi:dihydrofolate synthase / folylpolyglutamate synthase